MHEAVCALYLPIHSALYSVLRLALCVVTRPPACRCSSRLYLVHASPEEEALDVKRLRPWRLLSALLTDLAYIIGAHFAEFAQPTKNADATASNYLQLGTGSVPSPAGDPML